MKILPTQSDTPYPGVCRIRCGDVPEPTLLGYSGVDPRGDGLTRMGKGDSPVGPADLTIYRSSGRTVVSVPLEDGEKLYGFGLQYRSIEHRGQLFELRVDHYKGQDDGRTHAPVPFCISSRGYGMFINAAAKMWVYAGRTHRKERHPEIRSRRDPGWRAVAVSEIMEIALAEDGVEVLLFAGPSLLDVVRRFNLYCGGGCLPPKWGLGFWHRTPLDYTDGQVETEIRAFEEKKYPLDVIGLEPGWHSSSYPTTCDWHPEAFPDPAAFLSHMNDHGIRINLWENCFIHPECDLGRKLEPLSGSHTGSWGGYCPDLSMPEARGAITEHHTDRHVSIGVSGYKLDECDDDNWLFPDYAEFPSGITGERLHQVYGALFQRTTVEMYRKAGRRTYGQVRASNAGTVSFPYVIYNDCYDHREYITGLCSGSLSGVLFTPEARSAKTADEWLRRLQATCFSPLAQLNAWASGTKPWDFEDVADEVRKTMLLRNRLVPYLYSAFAEYREDGTPPFRAMVLGNSTSAKGEEYRQGELDATTNPYSQSGRSDPSDVSDQFMIGPNLLVAPFFAGESSRTVELPDGKWFDFYTGTLAGESCTIELPATTKEIPLFVCDGGIIPLFALEYMQVPTSGTDTPIEVRHYGNAAGEFVLYDDDGESYDYEQGKWCRWTLRANLTGHDDTPTGLVLRPIGDYTSGFSGFVWRFMSSIAPR